MNLKLITIIQLYITYVKMHINYFLKELEILNKRIFFSRKQNIMFLTTPKCGSQFTKLFCLLNLTDPTGQGRPNDFFNSNNPELR